MARARIDMGSTIEKARLAGLIRRFHKDGLVRIARPEGHEITAVLVLDPATGGWHHDDNEEINGKGFYSLCHFLGIDLVEASEALAPTPTPEEPPPKPNPQLQLVD